jgi:hypothetical protein
MYVFMYDIQTHIYIIYIYIIYIYIIYIYIYTTPTYTQAKLWHEKQPQTLTFPNTLPTLDIIKHTLITRPRTHVTSTHTHTLYIKTQTQAKQGGLKERLALIKGVEVDIVDQLEEYARVSEWTGKGNGEGEGEWFRESFLCLNFVTPLRGRLRVCGESMHGCVSGGKYNSLDMINNVYDE